MQRQACRGDRARCGPAGPARWVEGTDSPGRREDVLGAASGLCGRGGPGSLAGSGVEAVADAGRGLVWPSLGRGGASAGVDSGAAGAVAAGKTFSRVSLGCFGVVGISPAAWGGRVGVRGAHPADVGGCWGPGAPPEDVQGTAEEPQAGRDLHPAISGCQPGGPCSHEPGHRGTPGGGCSTGQAWRVTSRGHWREGPESGGDSGSAGGGSRAQGCGPRAPRTALRPSGASRPRAHSSLLV